MFIFLNYPFIIPAILGLLTGLLVALIIAKSRFNSLEEVISKHETTIAKLEVEESALNAELKSVQAAEAKLLQRQLELETRVKAKSEKGQEMVDYLAQTKAIVQSELQIQELALKSHMAALMTQREPRAHEPAELPTKKDFEGYTTPPADVKAGSAASVFRAALEEESS